MIKLPERSIHSLYPLALAEGEGVGTAYEYFAKRLALAPWLAGLPVPTSMLIAGLPEKYGSSLDFFLLAQQLSVPEVVVCDDRPSALDKAGQSLARAQAAGRLTGLKTRSVLIDDFNRIGEVLGEFDLCVTSEMLQRLHGNTQAVIQMLIRTARSLALFVPNANNPAHNQLSGLGGLRLEELHSMVGQPARAGYVDMPPFPPGLTRNSSQRQQATSGWMERLAMGGLDIYARLERFFPSAYRKRHSHIVYAFVSGLTSINARGTINN
jgi:hypothetical protein